MADTAGFSPDFLIPLWTSAPGVLAGRSVDALLLALVLLWLAKFAWPQLLKKQREPQRLESHNASLSRGARRGRGEWCAAPRLTPPIEKSSPNRNRGSNHEHAAAAKASHQSKLALISFAV